MIITYWPLLVSLGAVGLAYLFGVVTGRRGVTAARADAQRWEAMAEDRRTYIWTLEESLRQVASQDERNPPNADELLLVESKKHIEDLKAQLLQNQTQIIELLRAQLTEQEARVVRVEKLASDWAQVATEGKNRVFSLEVQAEVDKGKIAQLQMRVGELQKQLDQTAAEAA